MLFSVFIVLFLLTITACKNNDKPALKDYEITHEEEFGGIYIKSTIDDFNNLGFEYGDSVDIVFSNGKELKKIERYYPSSQICSHCGKTYRVGRSETYRCPHCKLIIDRDYNAAINILNYGVANN